MKKSNYLIALTLGASTITFAQNVGITTDPSTDSDANTILHLNDHSGSSLDSALLRIENEKSTTGAGVQIHNSGQATTTAQWDIIVPGSSTDLRIKGNGSDHVTFQNDGDVGIGTTSPNSGLDVQTSMGYSIRTIDAGTTLGGNDNVVLCDNGTPGDYTVTLPAAVPDNQGRVYYIKNIGNNVITIDGNTTNIEGAATYELSTINHVVQIISDGTSWHIMDEAFRLNGEITSPLDCNSPIHNGDELLQNNEAINISSVISYSGGNGGFHPASQFASENVFGLWARLDAGNFANGDGSLTFNIEGVPTGAGTAVFNINIGGQICTFEREVLIANCDGTAFIWNDVTSPTGQVWMDRNLGAREVAINPENELSYGDYYQWGRADDGHQCLDAPVTTELSSSATPGHGHYIQNGSLDWLINPDNTLWQGVNGTNNPCPNGYRVPTKAEIDAERAVWTSPFDSPLRIPLSGYKRGTAQDIHNFSTRGYFHTSSIGSNWYLRIDANGVSSWWNLSDRSYGYSVRCIRN